MPIRSRRCAAVFGLGTSFGGVGGIVSNPEKRIVASALAGAAALTFGWSLGHGYVYDDFAIFSADLWNPPWTRPLTLATFLIDARFASPVVSHALNLLLHLAAVLLAYSALRQLIPERSAIAAAAIFALHPLQVEPVSYVWARSTLLMTVFCLLSLRDWAAARHWRAVAWFGVALLAKEECVAWPLFLLIVTRSRAWRPLAAMAGLSVVAGAYVWWAASTVAGSQAGAQAMWTPWQYFSAQGVAILRYIWLLLVPINLSAAPQIPLDMPWAWLLVAAIAAIALRTRVGWWVLGGLILLLPSSSVFPANDLAADRRMYLPILSFAAGLSLIPLLQKRWIPVLLAALSLWRLPVWRSEESLWTDVLKKNPNSVRARIHLGRTGLTSHLEDAKKIAPDDPLVASELARAYLSAGMYGEALAEFGRALALAPNNPQAIANRGVALLLLKQTDAARADFERAMKLDPCHFEARFNLRQMGVRTPAADCKYTAQQQAALDGLR